MSKERILKEFCEEALRLHKEIAKTILLPTDEGCWVRLENAPPDHPFIVNLKEWASKEQSRKDCEVANAAVRKGL